MSAARNRANARVALLTAGVAVGMVGLAFASVPLYRMFCQVTGYGGVPQRAEAAPAQAIDRNIQIRFDANVDRSLPWSFAPVERQIDAKIGETTLALFKADNKSDAAVKGTAVFNVVPERAARYFNKIGCFCFKEQTLAPGQSIEMPVIGA